MKSDIVERLRSSVMWYSANAETVTEAADEIERLRAALQEVACDCEGKAICLGNCMHRNARAALEGRT